MSVPLCPPVEWADWIKQAMAERLPERTSPTLLAWLGAEVRVALLERELRARGLNVEWTWAK